MKKSILVPVSLAMHAKLKYRARQDGHSISAVVRALIDGYLSGSIVLDAGAVQAAKGLPPGHLKPRSEPDPSGVIEEIAAMAVAAAESD